MSGIDFEFALRLFFQLLLMVNPESPPWPSLEFSSRSQQGALGKFSELPVVYIISLLSFIFPEEGKWY